MSIQWDKLLSRFNRNPPAASTRDQVASWALPQDYLEFLSEMNGGEGWIGNNYVILDRRETLEEMNRALELQKYFPSFLVFGSDGGDEMFAFDFDSAPPRIVMIAGSIDPDDVIEIASSFGQFLNRLATEDLGDIISAS